VWSWIVIVAGYAFSIFFFRLVGGISSSVKRLRKGGHSPGSFARARLKR
jgi:hypothetical protein